jgi:hypothetical protein
VTLVVLYSAPHVENTGPQAGHPPERAVGWYTPVSADFRHEYDRDLANHQVQTWDEYWSWVEAFYRGNFFSRGWSDRARALVADVKSGPALSSLTAKLNAWGKAIAREWAKSGAVRKVNTADLRAWGSLLESARRTDDGRGVELGRAMDSIATECRRRLEPPPAEPD